MARPALIIDDCVNEDTSVPVPQLDSAVVILDTVDVSTQEFNLRLSVLDGTLYFSLDQDDLRDILRFLGQHGIKELVAS